MTKYSRLNQEKYSSEDYALVSIRKEDIMLVRKWRNEQMNILRQEKELTEKDQNKYFDHVIWPSFASQFPPQFLFSFLHKGVCIGYGGLVHISWVDKRAEVSFLLESERNSNINLFKLNFEVFLSLLVRVAFIELNFIKLTTEAYDIRPYLIETLEKFGFKSQGVLKKHRLIDGEYKDALLHALFNNISLVAPQSKNVLLTSISKKVPFIKAVKAATDKIDPAITIFGGDTNNACIGKYFVDYFWEMPIDKLLSIADVINYCIDNKIGTIIPTRDGELYFLAKNKHFLKEKGINVMVPDEGQVLLCLDKLLFAETLIDLGFTAIPTTLAPNPSTEKFVVKERFGSGSQHIGLNLTFDEAVKFSKKLMQPIFQPMITGDEFSIDVYISPTGKIKAAMSRSRDLVQNGESQITTYHPIPTLESLCIDIALKLGLNGHLVFQAIKISDFEFQIIECNTRFGGGSTLSVSLGLDSFYWYLLEVNRLDFDSFKFERPLSTKRQIRFSDDIIIKHPID